MGGGADGGSEGDSAAVELDLTATPEYEIESIWDLVGAEVKMEEGDSRKTWTSPWPADAASVEQFLPELESLLTTSEEESIAGRINVNTAPLEVLMAIPGMNESLAEEIFARSPAVAGASANPSGAEGSVGWLFSEGLVTIDEMRAFALYITGCGSVYRVQSLGYFDAGGPLARLEAVIDGTVSPPQVILQRDLTLLGRGFGASDLQALETETQ